MDAVDTPSRFNLRSTQVTFLILEQIDSTCALKWRLSFNNTPRSLVFVTSSFRVIWVVILRFLESEIVRRSVLVAISNI